MRAPLNDALTEKPSGHAAPRNKQRWLLIFNCQAMGLASLLTLQCDRIEVTYYDPPMFDVHQDAVMRQLGGYDCIVVSPWVERRYEIDFGTDPKVIRVPTFHFFGYHPDLCNISAAGYTLGGALLGNFSVISYAAFLCGLDERQAMGLYREDIFDRMGYFDQWDGAREFLLERYREYDFDLSQAFVNWSRRGPFANIPAHPKMYCLRDVAKSVLHRVGLPVQETAMLPHDNMMAGVVFPVYPEIGTRLGVRGDYLFKPAGKYQTLNLEEFVCDSFQFFRESHELEVAAQHADVIERAIAVIGARA